MSTNHIDGKEDIDSNTISQEVDTDLLRENSDVSRFQYRILQVLAGGDLNGSEIRQRLEKFYEGVNHGRLYPNLDTLADARLIEKRVQKPDNRTNEYAITNYGRFVLVEDARLTLSQLGADPHSAAFEQVSDNGQ